MNSADPYQILVERIREGQYTVGARLPSERALAEEFGVHRTTIQRMITRLTAEGFIERLPGCRPIVRGGPESTVRVGIVAVIVSAGLPIVNNAYGALLLGAQSVLRSEGYRLLFLSTSANGAEERETTEHEDLLSLLSDPVDGLILVSEDPERSAPILDRLIRQGTAVVVADRVIPGIEADFVGVDNAGGAATAARHLLDMGHTRLVFADPPKIRFRPAEERRQAFLAALRERGLPATDSQIMEFPSWPEMSRNVGFVRDWLGEHGCPTGIVCVHDNVAFQLAHVLANLGISIPDDISIIGFDDDAERRNLGTAQLTTIRQPFFDMGEDAATLLVNRLRRPDTPRRQISLAPTLVIRNSTRPLSGSSAR